MRLRSGRRLWGNGMRISLLQMDMLENKAAENRTHAEAMIRAAVASERPDVVVLPETWNLGFAPHTVDKAQADRDGAETIALLSALAKELAVNIVGGSVVNQRAGGLYNTAFVFDRAGECVASYDKTHLFSPMGEDRVFCKGNALCRFSLDTMQCAIIICYDLRFPELIRSLALPGLDLLFVVSEWPAVRSEHLSVLTRARAIENQMFVALCNSCGTANGTIYGGGSAVIDPLGNVLIQAGETETVVTADVEQETLADIRARIPVFCDRRAELYDM